MQGHPLGIIIGVADLDGAVSFLTQHLDMPIIVRTDESAVLDNGSVSLRFVKGLKTPGPIVIDVTTRDLDGTSAELGALPGCTASAPEWLTPTRKVVRIQTPYGLQLFVGRDFDEDELGIKGDIPTELDWHKSAIETLQELASHVPVAFRQKVREKTSRRAEELSVSRGELEVSRDTAVAALIEVTPEFQLERLREQLRATGLEPSRFEEHFRR